MRIFSRAHVSLAAPSFVLVGRVGIMVSQQFKVALELGLVFDFDFLKFSTLNCRDFEFPTVAFYNRVFDSISISIYFLN